MLANQDNGIDIFTKCGVKYDESKPRHVEIYTRYAQLDKDLWRVISDLTCYQLTYAWRYPEAIMERFKTSSPRSYSWLTSYWSLIDEEAELKKELKKELKNENSNT